MPSADRFAHFPAAATAGRGAFTPSARELR